jgi:hypothetical protein
MPYKRASAILLVLTSVIGACWYLCLSTRAPVVDIIAQPKAEQRDIYLFGEVLARIRADERYYDVLGEEMRRRNYGTRSIFNWRTPFHLWALGQLPGPMWSCAALILVAVAAVTVSFLGMERDGGFVVAVILAVILAPILALFSQGYLFSEVWAGTLIVFSVGLAACDRPLASVAVGLLALFVRELSLPYAVIALGLALREGRKGEQWAWATGFVVYAGYFALHAARVSCRMTDADLAYPSGWLRWGGPSFVFQTAIAGPIALLPVALTATYVPLAILGMIGRSSRLALRISLTTACYAILFSAIGKSFNTYWGLIYSPLLTFGFAWAPAALRDLARSLVGFGQRDQARPEIDPSGL